MCFKHLLLGLAVIAFVASPGITFAQKGKGGGGGQGGGHSTAGNVGGGKGSQGAGGHAQGNAGVKAGGNVKGNAGGNVKSNAGGNVRGNAGGNFKSAPAQKSVNPNAGKVQSNNQIRTDNRVQSNNQARINKNTRNDGVRNDNNQRRNTYYRGDANLNRNNSAFFGTRGYFGNNYLGSRNYNTYGNYGRGYGYGGYNGYGGYGLGYGYGTYGNRGFLPFLIGLGLGYGGYGGYGSGGYGGYSNQPVIVDDGQVVPQNEPVVAPPPDRNLDYAAMGEDDFRAGRYSEALVNFRHALVEEPNNAGLMLLLAQSLFQTSRWTEAAGATELAMGSLPEERWGTVVENYRQLYGNIGDYTAQLKALEGVAQEKPNDPALRFLLGYHFGYLGYPKQATRELGTAVGLEGRDPAARKLHDLFAAKVGAPEVGPVPEGLKAAAPPDEKQPVAADRGAPPPEPMPPQPSAEQ
jgi:tetratricopeptide (TPR) repeat protein